ncbi:MAG: FHA domain-containing protein, partial [Cyanobacteriota bacterium]|nr:FHA domain-containing protein [Cyanobacteriota bacterium]
TIYHIGGEIIRKLVRFSSKILRKPQRNIIILLEINRVNSVIPLTLTLLHPLRSTPIQSWEFVTEPLVQIGRASDNDIVLYSSVVSRYHVELRHAPPKWEIVSLGANGTYVDGEAIRQISVANNVVLHIAQTGPKLLLRLGDVDPNTLGKRATAIARSPRVKTTDLATGKTTFLTNRIVRKLDQQKPHIDDPADD